MAPKPSHAHRRSTCDFNDDPVIASQDIFKRLRSPWKLRHVYLDDSKALQKAYGKALIAPTYQHDQKALDLTLNRHYADSEISDQPGLHRLTLICGADGSWNINDSIRDGQSTASVGSWKLEMELPGFRRYQEGTSKSICFKSVKSVSAPGNMRIIWTYNREVERFLITWCPTGSEGGRWEQELRLKDEWDSFDDVDDRWTSMRTRRDRQPKKSFEAM